MALGSWPQSLLARHEGQFACIPAGAARGAGGWQGGLGPPELQLDPGGCVRAPATVNGRAGWREPGGPWEHTPSRAPASSRHAGPGNPPDHCPGLGEALIPAAGPPPRQSPSSLLSPQFSGMWYEIALASNLEHQSSSPQRKVGAVIVEQDGPHLSLTSVSDQ